MIEVSAIALIGAAFTIVLPFLVLITIMFTLINRRMDRIEDRLDRIDTAMKDIAVRVAVLEERGRSTAVTT